VITHALGDLLASLPVWVVVVAVAWALWAVWAAGPWPLGCAVVVAVYGSSHEWLLDLIVGGAVGTFLLIYLLRCWQDPHTPCWWCKGKSRRMNSEGHFHFCWVCHGSGKRDRFGAIVMGRADRKD
jgi:hypothetical protein